MTANELADELVWIAKNRGDSVSRQLADIVRQQQTEIEALKNANRFIQNFAQEQHQRAVALEMRELTDEEIFAIAIPTEIDGTDEEVLTFAKAILRKAREK